MIAENTSFLMVAMDPFNAISNDKLITKGLIIFNDLTAKQDFK